MVYKLKKFLVLSRLQKTLFLEAYATLTRVRVALLIFSFKQLVTSAGIDRNAVIRDDLSKELGVQAEIIGNVIIMAANNTPWSSSCLVQALTAQRMLQRRGIPGALHLGTARSEDKNSVCAHAWIQCGDTVVTGSCENRHFAVLSVFTWE